MPFYKRALANAKNKVGCFLSFGLVLNVEPYEKDKQRKTHLAKALQRKHDTRQIMGTTGS